LPTLNSAYRSSERPELAIPRRNRHICGIKSPKQKLAGGKLKRWRVSILRSRAHNLGTIETANAKAAEAEAVKARLERGSAGALILEREGAP
jgi:hypothetical protein